MRTGMTLIKEQDGIKAYIEMSAHDMARLKLNSLDRALMKDVQIGSPPEDILLALEMLFRRLGEQEPKP